MKLSEALKAYQELSARASDVSRQLAFAGIAVIWIFRVQSAAGDRLTTDLLLPLILFVSALVLDLMQYIIATLTWGWFHRHHEKKKKKDGVTADVDVKASKYLNYAPLILFWLKMFAVALAYVILFFAIKSRLFCI